MKTVKAPPIDLDVQLARVLTRLDNELRWEHLVMNMMAHVEYAIADQDEGEEWHGYLTELLDIFRMCELSTQSYPDKKQLLKYINGMSWDNFYDDEKKEYYSLGSMFYNKLTWIIEGDEGSDAATFAQNVIEDLPAFLDELERYANS
jgi:hypothetical protein